MLAPSMLAPLCAALAIATLVASVPFNEVTDLSTSSLNPLLPRHAHKQHEKRWRKDTPLCDQTWMGHTGSDYCCGRFHCTVELCTDAIQVTTDTINLKRAAISWLTNEMGDDCLDVISNDVEKPVMLQQNEWTLCPIDAKKGINVFKYNITMWRTKWADMNFDATGPWSTMCLMDGKIHPACFVHYCQLESQGLHCNGDTPAMDCFKI